MLSTVSMETINKVVAFSIGFIIDQVDDLVDAKEELTQMQTNTNYLLQFILICLMVYIIYFNDDLSLVTAYVFVLGGLVGALFAPNIVDATIWKIMIAIAIPKFIYTLYPTYTTIKELNKKDMYNLIYWILPLFAGATLFSLLENKLIPEEFSDRKILDRFIQLSGLLLFIIFNKSIQEKLNINNDHMKLIMYSALGWLGTIVSSIGNQLHFRFNLSQE